MQTDDVKLIWKTASEQNNSHYEIERSENGIHFIKIGTVAAVITSSVSNYSYLDTKPLISNSYYWLKQVDMDGKFNLYGPVLIKNKISSTELKIYTINGSIEINLTTNKTGNVTVYLFDVNGRRLAAKSIMVANSNNHISLPAAISAGVYMIKVVGSGIEQTQKFVK